MEQAYKQLLMSTKFIFALTLARANSSV